MSDSEDEADNPGVPPSDAGCSLASADDHERLGSSGDTTNRASPHDASSSGVSVASLGLVAGTGSLATAAATGGGSAFKATSAASGTLSQSSMACRALQQRQAQGLNAPLTASGAGHIVIVVDNVRFNLDLDLLRCKPETMLGRMFADGAAYSHPNEKGEHRILEGVSAAVFEAILGYYRHGVINIPVGVPLDEVREACDYLLVPFDASTIRTRNLRDLLHQLSNDGAHKRFEYFLDTLLLPKMAESARLGDRECHVVILAEEDTIEWDSCFPPPTGAEHTQTVFSTELCKFFKYAESRDVAKRLLKEHGFKKIRLGIEGYPTHKEKVKISRQPGQPPEAIYSYVQRPFVHVSWQKEESRSRHVDFQCVRSRPQSAAAAALEPSALLRGDWAGGGAAVEDPASVRGGVGAVAEPPAPADADHWATGGSAASTIERAIRNAAQDLVQQQQQPLIAHRHLRREVLRGVRQGCSCSYCQLLQSPAASPERN